YLQLTVSPFNAGDFGPRFRTFGALPLQSAESRPALRLVSMDRTQFLRAARAHDGTAKIGADRKSAPADTSTDPISIGANATYAERIR
ncbi:prolyl-tRNA synthetase, partial [Bacillus sp. AFS075960]